MEKYINQIVAIDTILGNPPDAHYPCWFAEQIANLPAADVIEVVHGEWKDDVFINNRFPSVRCSECNIRFCDIISNHRCMWYYCPNCGAKMDGGKE